MEYKFELASLFASIAVDVCRHRYELANRDSPQVAQLVTDNLNKTIKICEEIKDKAQLEKIEKESNNRKHQQYICRLEEMGNANYYRF